MNKNEDKRKKKLEYFFLRLSCLYSVASSRKDGNETIIGRRKELLLLLPLFLHIFVQLIYIQDSQIGGDEVHSSKNNNDSNTWTHCHLYPQVAVNLALVATKIAVKVKRERRWSFELNNDNSNSSTWESWKREYFGLQLQKNLSWWFVLICFLLTPFVAFG